MSKTTSNAVVDEVIWVAGTIVLAVAAGYVAKRGVKAGMALTSAIKSKVKS
jgi:hypothetical protein